MCRWSLNFFFLALNIHSKGHEWSGREDTVSWRFRNVRRSFHGWTFRVSQKNTSSGVFQHRQNLSHQHKNLTTSETTLQHISLNISHSLMWSQTKPRSPPEFRWGGVTQWIVKASEIQKFEMINDLFASNSASHVLILGKNSPSLRAWNKSFHPATSTSMYIHLRFTLLLASVFYQKIWLQTLKRNREKESASSLYNHTGYMSYIKYVLQTVWHRLNQVHPLKHDRSNKVHSNDLPKDLIDWNILLTFIVCTENMTYMRSASHQQVPIKTWQ